ncbi:type II toxin-antitoxin system MqsR family toxin [Bacillus thuringiensis]|uniref:type II toxin-antitoxin system MqsR family toxin n=1 Tax=Bacillus thuringiensis TaxID=1428 RepID=UPI0021B3DEDB|nr:type II toxin-antitoxin system MqsR family toxin [Bacillus thuringiensis]
MVLLAAFNGATQAQVEDILKKIVDCINRENDHFTLLAQRDKNEATLLELGFRPADVRRIVEEELTYEDYYRGPNPNGSSNVPPRLRSSDMWEFGKIVTGNKTMEVYIKFSFIEDSDCPFACCVSFHEPDRTITCPLKES